MATGVTPNYITPYKAGDSFTVGSGKGSYTGFLAYEKTARCIIPLTKPATPGLEVLITGDVRIRAFNSSGSTTSTLLTSISVVGTPNDTGIAVDFTSNDSLGRQNSVCSVGSAGITVVFRVPSS